MNTAKLFFISRRGEPVLEECFPSQEEAVARINDPSFVSPQYRHYYRVITFDTMIETIKEQALYDHHHSC